MISTIVSRCKERSPGSTACAERHTTRTLSEQHNAHTHALFYHELVTPAAGQDVSRRPFKSRPDHAGGARGEECGHAQPSCSRRAAAGSTPHLEVVQHQRALALAALAACWETAGLLVPAAGTGRVTRHCANRNALDDIRNTHCMRSGLQWIGHRPCRPPGLRRFLLFLGGSSCLQLLGIRSGLRTHAVKLRRCNNSVRLFRGSLVCRPTRRRVACPRRCPAVAARVTPSAHPPRRCHLPRDVGLIARGCLRGGAAAESPRSLPHLTPHSCSLPRCIGHTKKRGGH